MAVFFRVGPIAVAVFEVDAKVFDRFAPQFFAHAIVNRVGQPGAFVLFARALGLVLQKRTPARWLRPIDSGSSFGAGQIERSRKA